VGELLPVGQQSLFRQAVSDLGDLAFAVVELEGKAPACRHDGLQHLQCAYPQALRLAGLLGPGLLLTACPLALSLDPAALILQQAGALCGDLRRSGRATALNADQAANMQGTR